MGSAERKPGPCGPWEAMHWGVHKTSRHYPSLPGRCSGSRKPQVKAAGGGKGSSQTSALDFPGTQPPLGLPGPQASPKREKGPGGGGVLTAHEVVAWSCQAPHLLFGAPVNSSSRLKKGKNKTPQNKSQSGHSRLCKSLPAVKLKLGSV